MRFAAKLFARLAPNWGGERPPRTARFPLGDDLTRPRRSRAASERQVRGVEVHVISEDMVVLQPRRRPPEPPTSATADVYDLPPGEFRIISSSPD